MWNKYPFAKRKPGYEIQNKQNVTEVYIYDAIGWLGVEAETFIKDLKDIEGDVLVRINSPGGSVFDGTAIFNAIKERQDRTDTIVDGVAASAASYIALAGNTVSMSEGAFLMIHEPFSIAIGSAEDFRKEAGLLDKVSDQIAKFYAKKSGKDLSEVKQAMADETWFNDVEAKEFGLVDSIVEENPAENYFDLSVFNNVPDKLLVSEDSETLKPKDIEQALRDAGMSRQQAKAFYAEGKRALDEDDSWASIIRLTNDMRRGVK